MTIDLDELERLLTEVALPYDYFSHSIFDADKVQVCTYPNEDDATFIVETINALPELIRLAKIGKEIEEMFEEDEEAARNTCAGGEHAEGFDRRPTEREDT